jgi:hypothetical protein
MTTGVKHTEKPMAHRGYSSKEWSSPATQVLNKSVVGGEPLTILDGRREVVPHIRKSFCQQGNISYAKVPWLLLRARFAGVSPGTCAGDFCFYPGAYEDPEMSTQIAEDPHICGVGRGGTTKLLPYKCISLHHQGGHYPLWPRHCLSPRHPRSTKPKAAALFPASAPASTLVDAALGDPSVQAVNLCRQECVGSLLPEDHCTPNVPRAV